MATDKTRPLSQTRLVFERIRTSIVRGQLLPGAKLNIAGLADEIGVSAGAVREGLAMLEAEALVVSEPLKGYRVSPVSARELSDLVNARVEIEKLCLASAIEHGDLAWEGEIASAFHRLSRVHARNASDEKHLSDDWTDFHADFHHALVAGSPNIWLIRMHDMLYRQSERYRQLSAPLVIGGRDVAAEHRALMTAVLDRDVVRAQELISTHLHRTVELLLTAPGLSREATD
jgi:GntR family transcriptional regulator, carbon starvation induced regulator